jgi:hypothetical protein
MGWIKDLIYGKYDNDFPANEEHTYPDDPKTTQSQDLYFIGEPLNIPACSGTLSVTPHIWKNDRLVQEVWCSGIQIPINFGESNE